MVHSQKHISLPKYETLESNELTKLKIDDHIITGIIYNVWDLLQEQRQATH